MSQEEKEYEDRLQYRLGILVDQLNGGKVKFARGMNVAESLAKVRRRSDGSFDLTTVDGMVRSLALAVETIYTRSELKSMASLAQIQQAYFDNLELNFGHFFELMKKQKSSPHIVASVLARAPETQKHLVGALPEFLSYIEEFWEKAGEIAQIHIEDMNDTSKGVFGGDLFPAQDENIASKCGIYTDTIVLPDPFLRSRKVFSALDDERKCYFLLKHSLNVLQYKVLACADVPKPIVVVLPDYSALEEDEWSYYYELGKADSVVHAEHLFQRRFETFDAFRDFALSFDDIDKLLSEIKDPKRLLFDADWKGTLAEQFRRASSDSTNASLIGTEHPGSVLISQALGRMSIANELIGKAQRLRGTPVIDAPTSWQYFVWKLEYDALRSKGASDVGVVDTHVLRGLQDISQGPATWLGNVPPKALIELRKTGGLEEIRHLLGKGVKDLTEMSPLDFEATSEMVLKNIDEAFAAHRRNIEDLTKKKWKFAGSDIGSWLVVGSLAVTAAVTGTPIWGLAALAADQVLPSPKLNELPKRLKAVLDDAKTVKRSPVGLLFNVKKKAQKSAKAKT